MNVLFGRKVLNLKELKELTKKAKADGVKGTSYEVTREVALSDTEFEEFIKDFLKDKPWIKESEGGQNKKGELKCIRVKNARNKKSILVDSEGYTYPKYIAIEK